MHCPNINSPQWKSLVNKIGENNAWREFLKYGDAVYDRMNTPDNVVDTSLKSVDILQSPKAAEVFAKGEKNKWSLDRILTELQVPKDQIELLKQYNITDREQLITNMLADYSYTVEINTAKNKETTLDFDSPEVEYFANTSVYSNLTVAGGANYTENEIATPAITPSIKSHAQFASENSIGWFRSDDKQNYNEQQILSLSKK
jgi:hypothetical protein